MKPRPGPRGWVFERAHGVTENSDQNDHMLYQITLKNGTRWALDLTAAQYGHKDVLMPWEIYTRERASRILNAHRFGSFIDWFYKKFTYDAEDGILEINSSDPAAISTAITWSQHQISQVMLSSVQASLATLKLSARELLRMSSKRRFEVILKGIVHFARQAMEDHKQRTTTRIAESRRTGAPPVNRPQSSAEGPRLKFREDRNGVRHILV